VRGIIGLGEELLRRSVLDDHAAVGEVDVVGDPRRAKLISWVTRMQVMPSAASLLDGDENLLGRFRGSSAPVTSSNSMTSGAHSEAGARWATRCC